MTPLGPLLIEANTTVVFYARFWNSVGAARSIN